MELDCEPVATKLRIIIVCVEILSGLARKYFVMRSYDGSSSGYYYHHHHHCNYC